MKDNIVKIESLTKNHKIINYRVTEKCNYKCPYCWFNGRMPINLRSDQSSINNVLENLEYVLDYYIKQGCKMTLFLTGGEPSIYPLSFYDNLFKIIAKKKFEKIILSTNFSADSNWFCDFAEKCRGNALFEIKAGYHPSGCNIDDYIAKVKKVKDCVDVFVAHFTFDDNNFIGMEKINEIKSLGVELDVVPIHDKKGAVVGKYKISNPDLISLFSEKGNNISYLVYYKTGSTEDVTLNTIKNLNLSHSKPICYHNNITILNNKIGMNCEYMRAMKKVLPVDWLDISVKRSRRKIYKYLKNKCHIMCDRKNIPLGNNCTPSVLNFIRRNLFYKFWKSLF